MKLATWRTAAGLTLHEAGELFGATYSAVSKWESGERTPKRDQMAAIVRGTGGAVTACSFFDVDCAVEGACQAHRKAS